MKKYENPIMNVSLFDAENITTESAVPTAYELAQKAAEGIENSKGTFTVVF